MVPSDGQQEMWGLIFKPRGWSGGGGGAGVKETLAWLGRRVLALCRRSARSRRRRVATPQPLKQWYAAAPRHLHSQCSVFVLSFSVCDSFFCARVLGYGSVWRLSHCDEKIAVR